MSKAENQKDQLRHLEALARLVRYQSLAMTTAAGSGHPTSSLSSADLMVALWFDGWFRYHPDQPEHPNNDRLIFSKGHASPLYYALWYAADRLTRDDLRGYRAWNSPLEGHPTSSFPYVDAATGSLGQGLSIGVGFAINARYLDELPYRTYVLLGDSEMAEGSQWEALQCASHYRLGNLTGILDVNRLGQRGETMLGYDTDAYARRIGAFGWRTLIIDGHSIPEILDAYRRLDESPDTPTMIIARTIKGRGVKSLEDQEGWHGTPLDETQLAEAVKDLGHVDLSVRGNLAPPEDRMPVRTVPSPAAALHYETGSLVATRHAYGAALERLYARFPEIVVLDGEVSNSTKADLFKAAHPARFFEMFVAEQNMVGVATGLSRRGKIPFASSFAAFFTRAFDQIRMSPYSAANLKLAGSHAGVSIGEDGPSQMGLEDIAMIRTVPESVVLHPCDAVSTEKLVEAAARHRGLVYLRTMRQKTPVIYQPADEFVIGGSRVLRESRKDVVTIIAAGATVHEALSACSQLDGKGIAASVIDLYCIKPVDTVGLAQAASRTRLIVTVEDHYGPGGLGEAVRSALAPLPVPVFSLFVREKPHSGDPQKLRELAGISADAIVTAVQRALGMETASSAMVPPAKDTTNASGRRNHENNPLLRLTAHGQAVWLDLLSRALLNEGALRRLIHEDGVSGVTSNPAIFDEAITRSNDYDEAIRAAATETDDPEAIFERLAVEDIRAAADELQPVFVASGGNDGFVSLEVSPRLAGDTDATVERGRELWHAASRPNMFIKVPATAAGLPAIRRLIAEGINVNVTLLFGLRRYREVVDAYLGGLEDRQAAGRGAERVLSVASFFLSRIDTLVDAHLDELIRAGGRDAPRARRLRGRIAISQARLAYQSYREIFHGGRFQAFRERGLLPQRLLWASTGAKDKSYSDVKYVEALIGPETITTLPLKTLEAYRDHGDPQQRIDHDIAGARENLTALESLGITLSRITETLEIEGIAKFVEPYESLLQHVGARAEQVAT